MDLESDGIGGTPADWTQAEVLRRLGTGLILRVDPRRVDLHVGVTRPTTRRWERAAHRLVPFPRGVRRRLIRRLRTRQRFVLDASRYPTPFACEQTSSFARAADYLEHRARRHDSAWYRELVAELASSGRVKANHIKLSSLAEIERYFDERVDPLIASLESEGYRDDLADDVGFAMVGDDGSVHKSSAAGHRFAFARLLGVDAFPLQVVCVHADWIARAGVTAIDQLPAALRDVEQAHR